MPSSNNFPFRQTTAPFSIPVTDVPSQVSVGPAISADKGITSFAIVNSWPIWVWIKGSGVVRQINGVQTGVFSPAGENDGALIPPSPFFAIFSTQYPVWISAVAVERPGYPIYEADGVTLKYPNASLSISYGGGA